MKIIINLFINEFLLCYVLVIMACFVLHVIADFNLQGILTDLKQKSWWKKNYPDKKYEFDWLEALVIHSLFWSTFTFIPTYIIVVVAQLNGLINNKECNITYIIIISLGINTIIHAIVDHFKANKLAISLKNRSNCPYLPNYYNKCIDIWNDTWLGTINKFESIVTQILLNSSFFFVYILL